MQRALPTRLESRFLGSMAIEVERPIDLGQTPGGRRRFDMLKGGTFKGPRLNATILPGGNDVILLRGDSSYQPDVRIVMETDEGDRIMVTYRAVRTASAEVSARILAGEVVPYTEFYLRNTPYFETSSEQYAWLNGIVSVGVGRREGAVVTYEVFEVL